jgi:hypothetical protein
MSFAQVNPRHRWFNGHLVLSRRVPNARFRKIESLSRQNHAHFFRLTAPSEIDDEFRTWIAEAYVVGEQRHLSNPL